jgi:hypothetical protein
VLTEPEARRPSRRCPRRRRRQSAGQDRAAGQLIPRFIKRGTNIAVVTNDLVTKEDAERISAAA